MPEYLVPFCSRYMLVCSNHGRVEQETREVSVSTECLEHLSPDTAFAPTTEPFVDRALWPEPFGQVSPRRASACDPEHSIDKQPIVLCRPSRVAFLARQVWFDGNPLFVGNFVTPHQ